jgi:hypothetical protein
MSISRVNTDRSTVPSAQPVATAARPMKHDLIEASGVVSRFFTIEGSTSQKRSQYGSRELTIDTRQLKRANILTTIGKSPSLFFALAELTRAGLTQSKRHLRGSRSNKRMQEEHQSM